MANKRTYINADEELIIQGKLTIEGEFEQRDLIKSSTIQIIEYDGEQLLVNGDGIDETGNVTTASLVLNSGTSNATLRYNQTTNKLEVLNKDVEFTNNISAPMYTGNVTLSVPRNFSITGPEGVTTTPQPFDATSDIALPFELVATTVTAGSYGAADTVPTYTVDSKGRLTLATDVLINIISAQVSDFTTRVRGNVSHVDAGGDGSFSYDNATGVFTYTGPSLAEVQARIDNSAANVRAHISHVDAGGDGSLSYSSSTGVITYTGPSLAEVQARIDNSAANVRAHLSATSNIDYNSTTGVISQSLTTDDVSEGTNLYYTTARAQTDAQAVSINNVVEDTTPQLGGTLDINSQTIQGDLIPSANVTYDLGSSSARWQDIYLSGSTIYLDQHTLSIVNGELQFNNANVLISGASQVITGSQTFTGTVDLSGATVPGFTVNGNLDIIGDLNSVTQTDLLVTDANITLRQGATADGDSHIFVVSTGNDPYLKWDTGTSRWQFSNDGSTDNNVLLFSDFSAVDSGGDGSFSYANGVFTYTGPSASEVRAHFSATSPITLTNGVISINNPITEDFVFAGNLEVQGNLIVGPDAISDIHETFFVNTNGALTYTHNATGAYYSVAKGDGIVLTANTVAVGAGDGITVNANDVAVDNTVIRTTGNQSLAGTKTFTGELVIPATSATANGAIYHDNSTGKAYIYVGGNAQEITPAVAAGTVEDVGTTGINIFAGGRTLGNVTYQGIKSIDGGTYTTISESANVITVDGDISAIRGAFSGSSGVNYDSATGAITADSAEIRGLFSATDSGGDGSFGYNSTTGVFSYTGPSASEVRAHFSAGSGITLVNGVISATGDNYGSWTLQTDSGAGNSDTITSGETVTIQGGTNITVENTGNVITIRNDNAADITGVAAGLGLTGGGNSGAVTLNVGAGNGIAVNGDNVAVDMSAFSTTDLSEGTNEYYTVARANSAIDARVTTAFVEALNIDASSAVQAYVTEDNTNVSTQRLVFHGGDGSGNKALRHDDDLTYVPNTNTLTVGSLALSGSITGASISATLIDSGTLASARLPDLTVADFAAASIQTGAEAFTDSDTILMTAAAVQDKIESYNYSTTVGDITGVTAGTNLNGGGTSGGVTLNLDTTLTGMTAATFSGTVTAGLFSGTATSARYADLAEKYESDSNYEAGTVVIFGGEAEITVTNQHNDHRVAGIISTDPAYMMNSDADGQYVALRGRVPCKVIGPVNKGDVLITSSRPGFAQASTNPHGVSASCIVGKALQNLDSPTEGVIEVVV